LIGNVGWILLVGWALRPCNRSKRDKFDRKSRTDIIVRMGFTPCNSSRRGKLDRKHRVDIIGRMGFTPL
jgi:hypothetical protein